MPLAALVFSLFTAFGPFDNLIHSLQNFLVQALVPTQQEIILEALAGFTQNAKALGALGLLFFLITAIFLFNTIENNFSQIWGCPPAKGILSRFTTYTSVLVVGSILVAASFSLTRAFLGFFGIEEITELGGIVRSLLTILPTLFMALTFFLMIVILPSARVNLSSALTGALTGAVLWESAKFLFGTWANSSVRNSIIYGSLALIPIFLLWLYIGWLIILLSLVITRVHQYRRYHWLGSLSAELTSRESLFWGLEIFLIISQAHSGGKRPPSLNDLAVETSLPPDQLRGLIKRLEEGPLIYPVETAGSRNMGYLPARDTHEMKAREVAEILQGGPPQISEGLLSTQASELCRRIIEEGTRSVDISIADVLQKKS